jgi:hypothetical protein
MFSPALPGGVAMALSKISPGPRSLNEWRLSRLSFRATGSNGGSVRLPASEPGLLVFVQSRCLASYRVAAAVARHWEIDPPEFDLTLVLVDEPANRDRFLDGMPAGMQVMGVRPARLPHRLVASVPCAVSVGRGRRVRHAGGISGPLAFVRFTEACGDYQIRHWCRAAFTGWARAANGSSA